MSLEPFFLLSPSGQPSNWFRVKFRLSMACVAKVLTTFTLELRDGLVLTTAFCFIFQGKPTCRYGAGCYQTSKTHQEKFYHPPKSEGKAAASPKPSASAAKASPSAKNAASPASLSSGKVWTWNRVCFTIQIFFVASWLWIHKSCDENPLNEERKKMSSWKLYGSSLFKEVVSLKDSC